MPVRLYFDDGADSYRVYDIVFAHGRSRRVPLGDSRANYRVFVHESGRRRLYMFVKGDNHGITEPELEHQLRASQYGATYTFDTNALTPERGQR
jgi:hypothetical protein